MIEGTLVATRAESASVPRTVALTVIGIREITEITEIAEITEAAGMTGSTTGVHEAIVTLEIGKADRTNTVGINDVVYVVRWLVFCDAAIAFIKKIMSNSLSFCRFHFISSNKLYLQNDKTGDINWYNVARICVQDKVLPIIIPPKKIHTNKKKPTDGGK